jgi:hypothetical protein
MITNHPLRQLRRLLNVSQSFTGTVREVTSSTARVSGPGGVRGVRIAPGTTIRSGDRVLVQGDQIIGTTKLKSQIKVINL